VFNKPMQKGLAVSAIPGLRVNLSER
jgi:hypothetical protein